MHAEVQRTAKVIRGCRMLNLIGLRMLTRNGLAGAMVGRVALCTTGGAGVGGRTVRVRGVVLTVVLAHSEVTAVEKDACQ